MTYKQLCPLSDGKDECVGKKCEFWTADVCEIVNEETLLDYKEAKGVNIEKSSSQTIYYKGERIER